MEAVVEIDNVTKTFDSLTAVDRISLRLDRGETLGLIGPNGAGKTTLLRLISTLAKPDAGDIRIQGESVRVNPREVRKKLGFMPAEFGSPRNLSIGEYLEFFGSTFGIPPADRPQRIQDVCELTDLAGREDVIVSGLSTGNKQRLLLAKTLLHDPDILVLDEPASGLDPRARTELRGIMKALAAMGKTIIISSHILPDIEDISDRIGILEAGRLVLDGGLNHLRDEYGTAQRVLKLGVAGEYREQVSGILQELSGVKSFELRDKVFVIDTDEPNGNFVLREVIRHDIPVLQFLEDAPDLEEIFMRSTAGKVT